jgi:hypothetical protein
MDLLNTNFLFASLIWGSIGVGYWVYGKRQRSIPAMLGGIAMIAVSYFVGSWVWMSLLCLGVAVGVYFQSKRGD